MARNSVQSIRTETQSMAKTLLTVSLVRLDIGVTSLALEVIEGTSVHSGITALKVKVLLVALQGNCVIV